MSFNTVMVQLDLDDAAEFSSNSRQLVEHSMNNRAVCSTCLAVVAHPAGPLCSGRNIVRTDRSQRAAAGEGAAIPGTLVQSGSKGLARGKNARGRTGADLPRRLPTQISNWEAAVRARLSALAAAIPRIPQELSNATGVVSRDVNSGRPGLVIGLLAVLIAVGFGVEWLVRRALLRFRRADAVADPRQAALLEIAALSTFALASVGSFLAFEWPPLLRRIVLTFLLAVIAVRVVRTVARLLLSFGGGAAPSDQPAAPVVESDALPRFWRRRVSCYRRLPAVRLGHRQSHAEPGLLHRRGTARWPFCSGSACWRSPSRSSGGGRDERPPSSANRYSRST